MIMRLKMIFILFLAGFSIVLFAGEITVKGFYQGKNIYVMNPLLDSKDEFCVVRVLVNDQETNDKHNSSAFEIDLNNFEFKIGAEIYIVIEHKNNCLPKILNPEALMIRSSFNAGSLKVTRDGMLQWSTTNESGKLNFIIEQYRWNKWNVAGEVMGKGSVAKNNYLFKVVLNSGENKFRVKQIDYAGIPRYSREKTYRSAIEPIEFKLNKSAQKIEFTGETIYEIYSINGCLLKKGKGTEVSISDFNSGEYYLNYDNTLDAFKVK